MILSDSFVSFICWNSKILRIILRYLNVWVFVWIAFFICLYVIVCDVFRCSVERTRSLS